MKNPAFELYLSRKRTLLLTWITAVRPFAYSASVLPVLLGFSLALYLGYTPRWGLFSLTLLGVLSVHTAANLLNDAMDSRRGVDTQIRPTSGAVVRGWISSEQATKGALFCLAVGGVCAAVLYLNAGWPVLVLAAAGAGLALGYTTPGFCLKYAGAGDPTVFLAFGIIPVFGAFWVQAEEFHWMPIAWSIPLALYTVAILHANNWRDVERDRSCHCRTIASLLGPIRSKWYFRSLLIIPFPLGAGMYLSSAGLNLSVRPPVSILLTLLAFPMAIRLSRVDAGSPDFDLLDSHTARLHLLFGVLLCLAFLLG